LCYPFGNQQNTFSNVWNFGLGGVPGVLFGCLLAPKVPASKLKLAVAVVAVFAGLQLVWTASRSLAARPATNSAKVMTETGVVHAR
jgi:uncharacterized membrane protein YfcA